MDYDGSVGRGVNIELDRVGPLIQGCDKGGNAVFRVPVANAAVSYCFDDRGLRLRVVRGVSW